MSEERVKTLYLFFSNLVFNVLRSLQNNSREYFNIRCGKYSHTLEGQKGKGYPELIYINSHALSSTEIQKIILFPFPFNS